MRFESAVGKLVWDRRNEAGLRRSQLAKLSGATKDQIRELEDHGIDDEWILPAVQSALNIDPQELETCKDFDRQRRRAWLEDLKKPHKTFYLAATAPLPCPVSVPADVVEEGLWAVEEFARIWSATKGRSIALHLRSHIRLFIQRDGEMQIIENGFPD